MHSPVNIWWIRRDLRIEDNPTLMTALQAGLPVLPLFIRDPALNRLPAQNRQNFLFSGIRRLQEDLLSQGSQLVIRSGRPVDVFTGLSAEIVIQKIFAEEDYSPYARSRDRQVSESFRLILVQGISLIHPALVRKADGSPYTVFTPFSKAWKALPQPSEVHNLPLPQFRSSPRIFSEPWEDSRPTAMFIPGQKEARRRLQTFINGPIYQYREGRNLLDGEGTSVLSPYMRFGMISAREALLSARQAVQSARDEEAILGCETWVNELIWRDFYQSILYHFPHVLKDAFNPAFRSIPWRDSPADLNAWRDGLTGYPVVDAAMRQLRETGWMHNRARMIVASFLVKDLLINWQEGEAWFMQHLVDGDPATNNGGWQWTAGVGTDAAPYFRVFNPVSQGQKHDSAGNYVRRWVPELRKVKQEFIHSPWLMPEEEQSLAGCRIGRDYPHPIVVHAAAKERVVQVYQRAMQAYRASKQEEK